MNEVFKVNPDADFHTLLCALFSHATEIETLYSTCARNAKSIREILEGMEHLYHKGLELDKK